MRANRQRSRAAAGSAALAALVLAVAGCGGTATADTGELKASAPPAAPGAADQGAAATATEAFGLDLLRQLTAGQAGSNTVLSPSGLATALAMLLPGARGTTASELSGVLHATLPPAQYAAALGAVDRAAQSGGGGSTLKESDTAWTRTGYQVQQDYLRQLAQDFGTGLRTADFQKDPEAARKAVNELVAQQTEGRVKDLLPPGSVTARTVLVLTDALYFKGHWAQPFKPDATTDEPFHEADGSTVQAPAMAQTGNFRYAAGGAAGQSWQAVELPYQGDELAMDLVVPQAGAFDRVRDSLDGPGLDKVLGALGGAQVALTMPKFDFSAQEDLTQPLTALGVHTAFAPGADFSGISAPGQQPMWVSDVVQQADITVDEEGTTAAAGSGVVGVAGAAAPAPDLIHLDVDRPFLFVIRDVHTGLPLFLGQVTNPVK
ncbi:serpin family protein [Kitasatospora sp. LaBMicrA B282]|uniref:serpin family protein n=1 Tax=Kitasatospora sp. LaBMicrA B282 TaxID=3420949 RepID=UPI003D09B996